MSVPPYRPWRPEPAPAPASPPPLVVDRPTGPDPFALLFAQRRVFLRGALDHETATRAAAALMTLDGEAAEPVELLVTSPGGPVEAVWAVIDVLDAMRAPVRTVALGEATGTAAAVVACGTGGRLVAPHARLGLRLPAVEADGVLTAAELDDAARRHAEACAQLAARLAAATGRPFEAMAQDLDHGRSLTAAQACAVGLADEILSR